MMLQPENIHHLAQYDTLKKHPRTQLFEHWIYPFHRRCADDARWRTVSRGRLGDLTKHLVFRTVSQDLASAFQSDFFEAVKASQVAAMGNSWGTHGELVAPTTYGETSNCHDQVLEDFSSSVWTLWQILCVVQNFVSPVQFLKTALATYQRSNMHSIWLRKWPDMSVRRFVSKIWNHGNFTKRFFWQEPNNQNKKHAACHVFSSPYLSYGVYFLCCTTPNAGAGGTIGGMRTMPSKMPWQKYGGGSRPRSSPSICLSVWWKIMEYLQLKPL